MLIYFLRSSLPWQELPAKTKKEKYEKIRDKKLATQIEKLCKGYNEEFQKYMDYVRGLKFEDRPDAQFLRKLFKDLFYRLGYEHDYIFDWMVKKSVVSSKPLKAVDEQEELKDDPKNDD